MKLCPSVQNSVRGSLVTYFGRLQKYYFTQISPKFSVCGMCTSHMTRYMRSSIVIFYHCKPLLKISSSNHNWISRILADRTTTYSTETVKRSRQRRLKECILSTTLLLLTDERERDFGDQKQFHGFMYTLTYVCVYSCLL